MNDLVSEYQQYQDATAEDDEFEDEEEDDKKEFIREDLINFINKINEEARNLLKQKVNSETGELEKCEKEKLKVINDCKGPMWMLVNTTIFDTLENVVGMVAAMDEQ